MDVDMTHLEAALLLEAAPQGLPQIRIWAVPSDAIGPLIAEAEDDVVAGGSASDKATQTAHNSPRSVL